MPAGLRETGAEHVAAASIDLAHLAWIVGRLAECDDRCDLDRLERAVVEVRLQLRQRLHGVCLSDREADAPARHRERLRQAVQLDRALHRASRREDRRGAVTVEGDVGVRKVVDDQKLAFEREVDEPLHVLRRRNRGRRVVRERGNDDAWPTALERLCERIDTTVRRRSDDRGAGELRRHAMDGVGRRRHQHLVARSDHCPEQMREALLRPDRRHDLLVGIELDAEHGLVPLRDRTPQLDDPTARRVPVVRRPKSGLPQLLHRDLGRRNVGVPEAEIDHVTARAAKFSLQLVDFGEQIRRQTVSSALSDHERILWTSAATSPD